MSLLKKIFKRNLFRAAVGGFRDLGAGQSGDWKRNLRYNAPRVARSALGDVVFVLLALILAVMFVIAGIYQFFFASPLSPVIGGAAKTVLETTPNDIGGIASSLPQSQLGQTSIGGILSGAASGIQPILGALAGLIDEIFGILLVIIAVIVRFSHRVLALLIGNRPADQKGGSLSWIVLGICFVFFIFSVFVW